MNRLNARHLTTEQLYALLDHSTDTATRSHLQGCVPCQSASPLPTLPRHRRRALLLALTSRPSQDLPSISKPGQPRLPPRPLC